MEQQREKARRRLTPAERARRRRKRMLRRCAVLAVIVLALLAVLVLAVRGVLWLLAGEKAKPLPQSDTSAYNPADYVFDPADPLLVLVNGNLPQTAEPAAERLCAVETGQEGSTAVLLAPAAAAWEAMRQAAAQEDVALVIAENGGYQGAEQRPEGSEQGTGLALELALPEKKDVEATPAFVWLAAHATDYGFILRYPQEWQAVTGQEYRPQHWRYVGVENARAIRHSGLPLEAFLALQQENG